MAFFVFLSLHTQTASHKGFPKYLRWGGVESGERSLYIKTHSMRGKRRSVGYLHAEHAQCDLEENYGALVEKEIPNS